MYTATATRSQSLEFRDYQIDARNAINNFPKRRPVLVAPTGSGKTVMSSDIMVERIGKGPVLFLAHREELLYQTVKKLADVYDALGEKGTHITIGIVQADVNEMDADVVVASVQSFTRRVDRWKAIHPHTPTIITDECHHATAPTYTKIYDALGYLRDIQEGTSEYLEKIDGMHLGLTATPFRTDQSNLNKVFDGVAYSISMAKLIEEEYLVRPVSIIVPALRGVEVPKDDFSDEELDVALNNDEANQAIYTAWNKHASDRLTIGFATSVAHARDLSETFKDAGISSAYVSGETPKDERRDMLRRFSKGDIRALMNYGVLTEGFDEPEASALIMARPTTSMGLYQQQVGRGLRIAPWIGKKNCLVLDVVGVSANFPLVTVETLLGPDFAAYEAGKKPRTKTSGEMADYEIKQVKRATINWQTLRTNAVFEVADFDHHFVRVTVIDQDNRIARVDAGTLLPDHAYSNRVFQGNIAEAFEYGNTYAHVNLQRVAISKAAGWLYEPPSPKQLEAIQRRGIPTIPKSKNEAAQLLNRPTPKQLSVTSKFLKAAHWSQEFYPDTFQEAQIMLNAIFDNHWDVFQTTQALFELLPYKAFPVPEVPAHAI